MDALLFGGVHASFYSLSLLRHDLTLSVSEPDNAVALRKRGPTPNPAKIVYGKLEVVCYKISATNSSIKRFTCSGLSVLELCPAPSIHIKGIFVL